MDSRARSSAPPKDEVQKLGRYYLLNRIAQGGFAEVYRAVLDAGGGVHRLVAVKCLHSEHGAESEFSRAFRSEIKVSLGLAHPNIVPTYDFGAEDGRPYIVFEYIHGRSLRQVLTRMAERSRVLSVEHAAFIIEQSAAALHYAHTFRDPISRDPVEIIHRDVSPQNILLSFDGVPKIIDFGIAKVMAAVAEATDERTRTGVIKGKPAYLSPEQIRGDTLDGRSDVFALGIVLWETLTGVRLFGGKDHSIAIQAIMDSAFKVEPPSNINPAVPPELDRIVLNALARNREDRTRNARDLQNGLLRFLSKADGAKSRDQYQSEISDILSDIFAEEIAEDQAELKRLNEAVTRITSQGGGSGRRMTHEREFSLEEFSMIERARSHGIEETQVSKKTLSQQTTTDQDPPAPLGKTLVMLQLPKDTPDVPLDGPVNKGVMPEPQAPAKSEAPAKPETSRSDLIAEDDAATEPMTPTPRVAPSQRQARKAKPDNEVSKPNQHRPDVVPLSKPDVVPIYKPTPQPLPPHQQPQRADTRHLRPVEPPHPLPSAPPLPPGQKPERSISQRFTRTDLGARRQQQQQQPGIEFDLSPKGALGRVLLIFVGLMIALLLTQKLLRVRSGIPFRDRPIGGETPTQTQPDSPDHDRDTRKTFEPEAAPEYKDYPVPPIDIVPGNSRTPHQ